MQYDLWQLSAVHSWDKRSLNHSSKRLYPSAAPSVRPSPAGTELSRVLLLALSPSCCFSSVCLLLPSPKEASIKSPLEMRTGLDSYKLEQNNLFPKPHAHPGPTPVPICPISSAAEACERCCETESSSCLLMHTLLMWADSIRQHFWMPHTVFHRLPSTL